MTNEGRRFRMPLRVLRVLWGVCAYNEGMGKKFSMVDLSKVGDDKALAIAAFGESVAAYRYIVLSEKARDPKLRDSFEAMAKEERGQRDRLQTILQRISPTGGFYLSQE